MASLLYRLGLFGARRRRLVLLVWPLIVTGVVALGIGFAGSFESSASIPGSPAQSALERMDQHFPTSDVQSSQVVYQAPAGRQLSDPALKAPLESGLAAAAQVPGVTSVGDPFEPGAISPDGRTAVVDVRFSQAPDEVIPTSTLDALSATADGTRAAGVTAVFGGDAFTKAPSLIGPPELVGVVVALTILIITFGSLLSAGMPLLIALVGVVITITGMIGLSSVVSISESAPTLAAMLGLAVGIDYALFIVSRHRSQLADGMPVEESIGRATATAGSAVVFAGVTVVIALSGLVVAQVPMLTSMGLTAAGAVAVAVLTAIGLLPALLAFAGTRLIPKPSRRKAVQAPAKDTFGVRWVTGVTRHPVRSAAAVVIGLLILAAPALQLKLSLTDGGSDPLTSSTRQGYDLVAEAFGPGANGPLLIVIEDDDPATLKASAARVEAGLKNVPGIASASPILTSEDGAAARMQIIPATGPRTAETKELVTDLNAMSAPIADSTGSYVAVTGLTAIGIDVANKLSSALLPFIVVVVGLSLLLLMIAFRSIAVPIKATAGFLLSVGAAFGVTVAVFQWGFLADLIGVPSVGPIASFTPIILMAVLFGLAMDYEVFLVSSMREDFVKTGDSRGAVIRGARHASRIVTSAALIMIAVFISFVFSHDPNIMPVAFALAVGVLIDAFLVRMTLVPAVLTLLGDRAWWLPRRLDRVLPTLDVEGGDLDRGPADIADPDRETLVTASS